MDYLNISCIKYNAVELFKQHDPQQRCTEMMLSNRSDMLLLHTFLGVGDKKTYKTNQYQILLVLCGT